MSGTIRGIHVFWGVTAFFLVVIAVDMFFVMRAVSTFPGEEVKNSYVLGLDYNREVARRTQQAKLGWRAQVGVEREGEAILVARMADKSGAPLRGLEIDADFHVFGANDDFAPVRLIERAAGEYVAPLPLAPGKRVELQIEAKRPGGFEPVFEAAKTLVTP